MFKNLNIKQVERILMLFLIGFFIFWMLRQCAKSANEDKMQPIETTQQESTTTAENNTSDKPTNTTPQTNTSTRIDTVVQTQYVQRPTTLFVWADGLKVRSEPYLTSPVVKTLTLNSQVTFQDEVSSFKQKITMDGVEYDERWLKINTSDGSVGWVYGGGLRLYQK